MNTSYQGDVAIYGTIREDGAEMRSVRILTLGTTAKLMVRDRDRKVFVQEDILEDVVVSTDGGKIVFTGVSKANVEEIGLRPAESQAKWVLSPTGCENC